MTVKRNPFLFLLGAGVTAGVVGGIALGMRNLKTALSSQNRKKNSSGDKKNDSFDFAEEQGTNNMEQGCPIQQNFEMKELGSTMVH